MFVYITVSSGNAAIRTHKEDSFSNDRLLLHVLFWDLRRPGQLFVIVETRESMIRFFPSTLVQSLSGVADGVTAVNQIGDPLV
jgi:hypothetical protein